MLLAKAKVLIIGLPINAQVYERTKAIMDSSYAKPTQVAKAHVYPPP